MGIESPMPSMAPHVVRMDIVRDVHGQSMTTTYIDQFINQVEIDQLRKISPKICTACQRARLHELNSNELACANAGYA